MTVWSPMAQQIDDLVLANRILSHEGALDAFGHVSMRDTRTPDRFLISRSRSPQFVEADDIREFDLDSHPLREDAASNYAERVIHGCIYRARPDVMAVCHFHAAAVLPFANTGTALVPVTHVGAVMGQHVPFWDARDEFGDTNMLVASLDQGHSLARALGTNWALVIRRHGAVVAARSVRELVFRTINMKLNAEVQLQAVGLGALSPLTSAEIDMSAEINLRASVQARVWEYWSSRLPADERPMPCHAGFGERGPSAAAPAV